MVSVVMITFNQKHYIERAIKGVLNQQFPYSVQLIICDDCSTDGTAEIAEKWKNKYPDVIQLMRNEINIGLGKNYIQAYGMCRGKYIAMCDADDYWISRKKLLRQVKYMESHPECAVTYHRVLNFYEESGEKRLSNGGGKDRQSTSAVELAQRNTITNLSVMYRADLVDISHLPLWLGEMRLVDYAMHLFYASKGSVHYMPQVMGVYRRGSEGIWTHAVAVQKLKMAFDVRLNMMHELADYPDIVNSIRISLIDHIISIIAEGDKGLALQLLPLVHTDIDITELFAKAENRKVQINKKKSFIGRLIGIFSRLLPLPHP